MKEFKASPRTTGVEVLVPFRMKGDDYEYNIIASDPPAAVFFDIALLVEGTPIERLAAVARILDSTLTEESAAQFGVRLRDRDPKTRIDINQAVEVTQWVLKEITDRPTSPSSASSTGEEPTGELSTARSPAKRSTR